MRKLLLFVFSLTFVACNLLALDEQVVVDADEATVVVDDADVADTTNVPPAEEKEGTNPVEEDKPPIEFDDPENPVDELQSPVVFVDPIDEDLEPEQVVLHDAALKTALAAREGAAPNKIVALTAGADPFVVSDEVMHAAYMQNRTLNESILFYTNFLKNRKQVRDFLQDPRHFNGRYVKTNTSDNETIHYTHFDRGSDTLLVIGGAMLNQERVASFVKMFNQYDVVIFNHRGIEHYKGSITSPTTWPYCISSGCVFEGFNGSKVKLGDIEERDVFAVIYDIYKRKTYKKIYGLGLCYSAPIFMKAATIRPGLFDKLILDGSWIDAQRLVESYISLWFEQHKSGWLYRLLPTDREWFHSFFCWIAEKVSGLEWKSIDVNFVPYLQKLETQVLFIHSVNDVMVPTEEFEDIWALVPTDNKTVLLTANEHIRNHLKQKEFYKYVGDSFFGLPYEEFVKALHEPVERSVCP